MPEPQRDATVSSLHSPNSRASQALDSARHIVRRLYGGWAPVDQEDLVSEVIVKYLRTFGDDDGPDNLEAWLTTVARNAARDSVDQRGRRPSDPIGDPAVDLRPQAREAVATWLKDVETFGPSKFAARHDLLTQVLGLLDEADRELITKKYLDHWSAADLANESGVTVAAVNQRVYRARRHLDRQLAENPGLLKELRADMPRMY